MDVTVIILSLLFSAFFSGMEIAFFSSNKLKIALDKESGSRSEKIIFKFLNNQSNFITTMLIGNNIALVVYGLYMAKLCEPLFLTLILNLFPSIEISTLTFLVGFCEVIVSSMIVLVIAEFLPKAIFSILSNKLLKIFAMPTFIMYKLLKPVVFMIMFFSRFLLKMLGLKNAEEKINFNRIDLDNYLEQHYTENQEDINPEVEILKNALDFSKIKVRDCMIPRTDVVSVDVNSSMDQLNNKFLETGHSKIIVYKKNIDHVMGYVHSYELFKKPEKIRDMLLPISLVPESMLVKKVLDQLLRDRRSIAAVLDEYGGTAGIICLEDIVEELFGEIQDEHDIEEIIEEKITQHKIKFSAKVKINYLNERYNLNLPESSEYETLGGLILFSINKVPEKNEKLDIKGSTFIVSKVMDNFIEEVILVLNDK